MMKLFIPIVAVAAVSNVLLSEAKDTAREASTARWLTTQSSWGTLTTRSEQLLGQTPDAETGDLLAVVLPFAADDDNEGRIFFYLMGESHLHGSALTLSQAALNSRLFAVPGCGREDSAVDPQDPRCIKLTVTGSVHPCTASQDVGPHCQDMGWKALLQRHPSMAQWPEDHDFHVHEFVVQENMWMIASFGGASSIPVEDYASATATEHTIADGDSVTPPTIPAQDTIVPKWNNYATRARWIAHHSKWSTIATVVSEEETRNSSSRVFGNIRSISDGMDLATSTGLSLFYLPDADALAVNMKVNGNQIVLSLSEASLAQRVDDDQIPCGGQELPLCAQVALYGTAVPISFDHNLANQFKHTHPLASWMAEGGSHMSGSYYTIEISKVVILDYFGGFHDVGVEDYLNTKFSDGGEQIVESSWWNGHPMAWMVAGFLIGLLVARYCCSNPPDTSAQYRTVPDTALTKENVEVDAEM